MNKIEFILHWLYQHIWFDFLQIKEFQPFLKHAVVTGLYTKASLTTYRENYNMGWLLICVAFVCDFCIRLWILHTFVNFAYLCDFCIHYWFLHTLVNFAYDCEFWIRLWILHTFMNFAYHCDYCIRLWILHTFVIIAYVCEFCIHLCNFWIFRFT